MLRRIVTATVTVALAVSPGLVTGDDHQRENPPPGTVGHRTHNNYNSYVEIVGVDENEVDRSKLIGKCTVESPGSTCTISKTETVSRTISAEFGATSETVSAAIGVSASQSVAVSIGCQSEKLGTDQEYVAFPTQTLYSYRVVTDNGAYVTDLGQYIPSGSPPYVSPVVVTAAYDGWFRCRSRPLQP